MSIPPSAALVAQYVPITENRISHGRQHTIFLFNKDYIIKIPHKKVLEPRLPKAQILEDLSVLQKYFPHHIPWTCVYDHPQYGYVILQKYISGIQPLTPNAPLSIKKQLRSILRQNRKMKEDTKLSLDFFGHKGFLSLIHAFLRNDRRCVQICNLGISSLEKNRIYILDTNLSLLTPKRDTRQMWFQFLIDIISYNANKWFLQLCFRERA